MAIMTARRVPVKSGGTTRKVLSISMGRLEESCGIWVKVLLSSIRKCNKTSVYVKSLPVSLWSAYNMDNMAEVQAPPALPAGSGNPNLAYNHTRNHTRDKWVPYRKEGQNDGFRRWYPRRRIVIVTLTTFETSADVCSSLQPANSRISAAMYSSAFSCIVVIFLTPFSLLSAANF